MPKFTGILLAVALLLSPEFVGAAGPAKSPPPPQTVQELDGQLAALLAKGHIPGATVAIIENGQVTFAKGYGYADVAKKIPATADTPFRAGSISKAITSSIMKAQQQREYPAFPPVETKPLPAWLPTAAHERPTRWVWRADLRRVERAGARRRVTGRGAGCAPAPARDTRASG